MEVLLERRGERGRGKERKEGGDGRGRERGREREQGGKRGGCKLRFMNIFIHVAFVTVMHISKDYHMVGEREREKGERGRKREGGCFRFQETVPH